MLIPEKRPDVVLLDLYLPGLDGLEVLKRIMAVDATIPVIMATAHNVRLADPLAAIRTLGVKREYASVK